MSIEALSGMWRHVGRKRERVYRETPELVDRLRELFRDERLKAGVSIDDELFSTMRGFPLTLVDGDPLTSGNISTPLLYGNERIVKELFYKGDVEIVLTNDHPHLMKFQKYFDTANSRRRWYLTEVDPKGKKYIYIQIRDEKLDNSTDAIELVSFFNILSLARKAKYKGKLASELKKLKVSPEQFKRLQKSNISVKMDFDDSRKGAVDILVEQLKRHPFNGEKKPFLLIGNDYSFRLLMFTVLINEAQVASLRNMFADNVQRIKNLLDEKQIPETYRGFVSKYILLTLLDKSRHKNPEAEKLHAEIFSQDNYNRLGYKRLLYGVRPPLDQESKGAERSVMAEPVDYWDPTKFDQTLLQDETDPIHQIFRKLIEKKQPLLSISYVIGGLSVELPKKLMESGLISNKEVGFVGKVAHYVRGREQNLRRGDLTTVSSCMSTGSNERVFAHTNRIRFVDELAGLRDIVHRSSAITVPAVTIQTFDDFDRAKDGLQPLVIEMEQYDLIKFFNDKHVDYYSAFYISDILRKPINILTKLWHRMLKIHDAEKIINHLDTVQGALAVALSTLIVMDSFVKQNGSGNGTAK